MIRIINTGIIGSQNKPKYEQSFLPIEPFTDQDKSFTLKD